jgi:hypothetical protein
VTTLSKLFLEPQIAAEEPRVVPINGSSRPKESPRIASLRSCQIQALVQQLFFQGKSAPVRHVGFAAIEASNETEQLCLDVATSLAEGGRYDVGLIDANPSAPLLQSGLQITSPGLIESSWLISPRLRIVTRQYWLQKTEGPALAEENLSRLRETTSQFDFSILWCAPVSWLTVSVAQACDGLALVLTANKTRRLVAAQIKEQLRRAQVPLLGTVLADRRFPVPQSLYRSL